MRAVRCGYCQPSLLDTEPLHCFGTGDTPSIDGLIGSGNRCSCDCRGSGDARNEESIEATP